MNRKNDNILWGILLIVAGIAWGGRILRFWNFDIFFPGWWTLFIIIPSAVGLFQKGNRWNSVAGLTVGGMLLLSAQDIITWGEFGKLVIPLLLVIFGLQLIFNGRYGRGVEYHQEFDSGQTKDYSQEQDQVNYDEKDFDYSNTKNYSAIFSGQEFRYPPKEFTGANILCLFSGLELDLRNAVITQDVTINCQVIFGGAEIHLPSNVNLEVSNVPILGGVGVSFPGTNDAGAPTVYVSAVCVLGGLDIK